MLPSVIVAVAEWYDSQRVLLSVLHIQQRRLEEVFLDLTGREIRT